MTIAVEVISREIIKPYTTTADHLRHYQFSFLDQLSPTFHGPLIYFYRPVDHENLSSSHTSISSKLKSSLSKVLAHYYPLAGCIKDNYVDCNDEGVLFLEAQVDSQFSHIKTEHFNKFFPYVDRKQDGLVENFVLAIQVNFFKCGTFAIAALICHKIADALSMLTFISNWAATARRGTPNFCPEFVSATLFPPKDVVALASTVHIPPEKNIVSKMFLFSNSAIAAMKEKYTDKRTLDNDQILHPTRFEALASFIWSRFTASTQTKKGLERPCMLSFTVNFRNIMDQPLSDNQSFGNMFGIAPTFFSESTGNEDQYRYGVVSKLRDAKSKVNKDYVKKLQQGIFQDFGLLEFMNNERLINQEKENRGEFYFSSLCGFPVYEADFGWGRPVWFACGGFPFSNMATLLDTKCGDGVEAWIHLKEGDMAKFESDKDLLSLLSFHRYSRL